MKVNCRKTHCDHGHRLHGHNRMIVKDGKEMRCRQCHNESRSRYYYGHQKTQNYRDLLQQARGSGKVT